MYLSIIIMPLISFLTTTFFGRFLGQKSLCFLSISCIFLAFLSALFIFYEVCLCKAFCSVKAFNWIISDSFVVSWGFLFDNLSVSMLIVITSVSFVVHLYSLGYMHKDPHQSRFMSYLSLFTFFMLVLVTADNFVQMFVGWEGVGLVSYLLINFWSTRIQANKSAIKAMLVNRIGDVGLCLAICGVFVLFDSLDYTTVFSVASFLGKQTFNFFGFQLKFVDFITFFIFWGSVGKSAQIGLHSWLPDAMEGPTPVSALIHAATMVTAGVFIVIRSAPLFELSPSILYLVSVVGASTAFFASSSGLVQNDVKRVIAYSTCSQLGFMVFACGLSNYSVAFFHLSNHAFFKALLFLGAGCLIHGIFDEQDLRKMGLGKVFIFTYTFLFIGSLALTGFPFLTGFYSKDTLLELSLANYSWVGSFTHILGLFAALLTSLYSFRLLHLTFLNAGNTNKSYASLAHESPLSMSAPLVFLSFGAVFVGFLSKDFMVGAGSDFWNGIFFVFHERSYLLDSEFLFVYQKHLPFFLGFFGCLLAYLLVSSSLPILWKRKIFFVTHKFSGVYLITYRFFSAKWHFDQIYNELVSHPIMTLGYSKTFLVLDKGFIEIIGPLGISEFLNSSFSKFSNSFTGYLYHYGLVFIIASFLVLISANLFSFFESVGVSFCVYNIFLFCFFMIYSAF
jgi:proton-translocating NADH-quinone oxidoreductase chain L